MLDDAVGRLRSRLPNGWRLTPGERGRGRETQRDPQLVVKAPDGAKAVLLVQVKRRVSPRQAAEAAIQLAEAASRAQADGALLVSDYLSELSRKRLRAAAVGYLDLTGNAWITLQRPGLFIQTHGSDKDPSPPRRGTRSLKGIKAARIVRALCDVRPPIGIRALARFSGANAGYVSRMIDFLVSEDLVQRGRTGEIVRTDWQDLIRRWGQDYGLTRTNRAVPCLAPRGLAAVTEKLRLYEKPYALTGSLAVPKEASVAAGRLVTCYADDPEQAADFLGARPEKTGANLLLLEPFDRVVYDRAHTEDGLVKVAHSQCAVDLLTGAGRGPAEADALLEWMAANEDAWRS